MIPIGLAAWPLPDGGLCLQYDYGDRVEDYESPGMTMQGLINLIEAVREAAEDEQYRMDIAKAVADADRRAAG